MDKNKPETTRRGFLEWSIYSAAAASVAGGLSAHLGIIPESRYSHGVLPAEFENHEAVLFAWYKNFRPGAKKAFIKAVVEVAENGKAIVLVKEDENLQFLKTELQASAEYKNVTLIQHDFVMPWIRDFGPVVIKTHSGGYKFVDYQYDVNSQDNGIPSMLANYYDMPIVKAPIKLHAGNLLSNGMGLCISTEQWLKLNNEIGFTRERLDKVAAEYMGINDLVMLRPLIGEQTGHVDMFATMVATDIALVGKYEKGVDRHNAPLLDRNAELLEGVMTPSGPLKVFRIPMPPRPQRWWYTYTNVVYANGKVLVPSYKDIDAKFEQKVFDLYQSLLPGWKIVPIDCTEFVIGNGVLHCATMNLKSVSRA